MARLNRKYGQYTILFYSVVAFLFLVTGVFGLLYLCCASSAPDITPAEEAHIDAIMEASLPGKRKTGKSEHKAEARGKRTHKED